MPEAKPWLRRAAVALILAALAVVAWRSLRSEPPDPRFVSGNGRIEVVELDVAARAAGRVKDVLAREGDPVEAGQVVATMDTAVLDAQLAEAQAQLRQARNAVEIAASQLAQRRSERAAAQALVAQRQAERAAAGKRLDRSRRLSATGAMSAQEFDDDSARAQSAEAASSAAQAQVAAADAAIATARSQAIGAQAAVDAAQATIRRLEAEIADTALKAPRAGRVQYRVAQPGEVLAPGGKVMTLIDLSDVYMTFFLPETVAGRVPLGAEVRIVLDAAPQLVIPAQVSFVADVAQFTPKTVETASERQKLMFRVRARIDPELLARHASQVKAGLPGVAHLRLDPAAPWPAALQMQALQ